MLGMDSFDAWLIDCFSFAELCIVYLPASVFGGNWLVVQKNTNKIKIIINLKDRCATVLHYWLISNGCDEALKNN